MQRVVEDMAAAAAAALALTMPILDEQNVVVDDKKLSLSRRQDFQIATTVEEEHEPKERLLVDDHEDEGCSVVSLEPASSSSSSESYSGDCTPSTSSFSSIAGSPLCTPTRVENDDDEEARIEFDLDSLKGKGKQTTSRYAAEIVRREAKALLDLAARLDRFQLSDAPSSAAANVVDNVDDAAASFDRAVELLSSMDPHGKVIITGIGKSGLLARKAVATFNSLGECAHVSPSTPSAWRHRVPRFALSALSGARALLAAPPAGANAWCNWGRVEFHTVPSLYEILTQFACLVLLAWSAQVSRAYSCTPLRPSMGIWE